MRPSSIPSSSLAKRSALAAGTAAALALSLGLAATPLPAHAETAALFEKSETVYGSLDASGAVQNLYVVNQFDVEKGGLIEDYGNYDRVENLTNFEEIATDDEKHSIEVEDGIFYYQGDIQDGSLPWDFDITYMVDGKEVPEGLLAGQSGRLKISIDIEADPDAADLFKSAYVVQASFSIPTDRCDNITVSEEGTVVNVGSDRKVSYTVMPGQAAHLTFEADVDDFEMSGISFSGAAAAKDMEMRSFMSPENTGVAQVLFSLSTPELEIPEVEEAVEEEPEKGFIERLLALFGM